MKRVLDDTTDIGYDNIDNSIESQYIVQPYKTGTVSINQNSANKYTITFWRGHELSTKLTQSDTIDNILPDTIKVTEISADNAKPIYGSEHESIVDLINTEKIDPQLMVQWQYTNGKNSPIKLRFNNAFSSDSVFKNTNAGLEYKSLSLFTEYKDILPGESAYIDIVAPQHIQIGRTVFYNIPMMRALVSNISDNKPKFMLTIINDKIDEQISLTSNNYALVFMSASTPQESNSNIVYVQCYVAPILSNNQNKPPSIANAISLSELSFNFDVANIMNGLFDEDNMFKYKNLIAANYINAITNDNKLSSTAKVYTAFNEETNNHQIRVSEPYTTLTKNINGFKVVDIKVNLNEISNLKLKNIMFNSHGDVIAYDSNRTACPIVKIFGTSLENIGMKHVLGVTTSSSTNVLNVTQNSGRTTAIQINKNSAKAINGELGNEE
jgi:hypothetical protein